MHRVGTDVATTTFEFNFDNHQVVDMFKVITDCVLGEPGVTAANDKISSGTEANLACDMTWQEKVAIAPTYINLY